MEHDWERQADGLTFYCKNKPCKAVKLSLARPVINSPGAGEYKYGMRGNKDKHLVPLPCPWTE